MQESIDFGSKSKRIETFADFGEKASDGNDEYVTGQGGYPKRYPLCCYIMNY